MIEYGEAIRLKPDHPDARVNLGAVLHQKGQIEDAITEYRKAILIKPALPNAHYNLGLALQAKGNLEGAIADIPGGNPPESKILQCAEQPRWGA